MSTAVDGATDHRDTGAAPVFGGSAIGTGHQLARRDHVRCTPDPQKRHQVDRRDGGGSRTFIVLITAEGSVSCRIADLRPHGENLHRDQLLRRLLAGLERMDGVTRPDLPRLSRGQVGAQLAGILGRPPEPPVLSAVYQRSGGNPLFTEALVGQGGAVSPGLPLSLRDLLLATIQDLPEKAQQVVRAAAVGGSRVGHALLAAVTGLDNAALAAALRPAVAASVLVSDIHCYVSRHELIREAAQGDLLAGERAQLHRRFAETLEADPALSLEGDLSRWRDTGWARVRLSAR